MTDAASARCTAWSGNAMTDAGEWLDTMDSRDKDKVDEISATETPQDVAVLYSWANVHGAKYRDFSASRREYRAQLRHRAAEQVRERELLAQAEAENAAAAADAIVRQAAEAARTRRPEASETSMLRAVHEAEEAAQLAAAERVEAARRAEAAAIAEATARREEREIAEAHESAQRQAERYAESEMRRKTMLGDQSQEGEAPGNMIDPYTSLSKAHPVPGVAPQLQREAAMSVKSASTASQDAELAGQQAKIGSLAPHDISPLEAWGETREERRALDVPRRRQGYRPDNASGVRQIYRGPGYDGTAADSAAAEQVRGQTFPASLSASIPAPPTAFPEGRTSGFTDTVPAGFRGQVARASVGQRRTDLPQMATQMKEVSSSAESPDESKSWLPRGAVSSNAGMSRQSSSEGASAPSARSSAGPRMSSLPHSHAYSSASSSSARPFSQALVPSDFTRGRRPQDDFDYQTPSSNEQEGRGVTENPGTTTSGSRAGYAADTAGPAWLYAPSIAQNSQRPAPPSSPPAQSSVADTLQHSRERVAARWFALKGVFEQPGQEQETAPVRQKETRTPVLAVFSLAGGVGKTSLVATVGRSLSSMGEKVLLADTTSHGLLPYYFGASELRQGAVRTFSPPSGSTDAPIYLVSYDVDQRADEEAQEQLAEEILGASLGTHRILLDLTVGSSWIVSRLSRMNPTILVPVAPDMNSVISLQTVEKFFGGINDGDGRPLRPYYVLNQFDASLPLHLDVREVMRRQLGERLLPFVIRRAPAVSEALAEGMTVVDYAPDASVAEDYLNLATWLRTVAAPATAGFRNVRWSER